MPLTEDDLKAINEKVFSPIKNQFDALEKKIVDLETQFPGMSKKHAAEARAEMQKALDDLRTTIPAPKKEGNEKKDTESEALRKEVEFLKAENEKAKIEKEIEAKRAEVAKALGKYKIVSGLEDYAHEDLMKRISRDEKGNFVFVFKDKLQASNEEIEVKLGVEKGLERFFKEKKALLQGEVRDGAGSGGQGGFDGSVKPTWKQLQANAKLLAQWQEHDPEHVRKVQDEALEKLRGA